MVALGWPESRQGASSYPHSYIPYNLTLVSFLSFAPCLDVESRNRVASISELEVQKQLSIVLPVGNRMFPLNPPTDAQTSDVITGPEGENTLCWVCLRNSPNHGVAVPLGGVPKLGPFSLDGAVKSTLLVLVADS